MTEPACYYCQRDRVLCTHVSQAELDAYGPNHNHTEEN